MKNLDFIYFGELDSLAHKYGTKSKEMIDAIKKIDNKISKMKFDIIFSDHGMADVKKRVSVPEVGDCFIDGDMARYWGSKKELGAVKKKLPLKSGKIISWKDKRFGDLIFMANTGVLIYPNFWDGMHPSKAMHGYDGKHKDMKAFYVISKKGKKKNLKVKDLHKVLNKFLLNKNGRQ